MNRLGNTVLMIDDLSCGSKEALPLEKTKFVKGDIIDRCMLGMEFESFKPDRVIHLAAIHFIPFCNLHPLRTLKVNIMGTKNLVDCCRRFPPKKLLFSSTAAVYSIEGSIKDEDASLNPVDIYGITKLAGEAISRLFARETSTPTTIARIFNVYGPNDTILHVITETIRQTLSGSHELELGNLALKRDFIHVSDVAEAILALLEYDRGTFNVFNVGSGNEYSVREIVEIISEITSKEMVIKQAKERMRKNERTRLMAGIKKIKEITGWSP